MTWQFFLIDDSSSMKEHWDELREVCEILAYMVKEKDPDGFDLHFTVSLEQHKFRRASPLEKVLREKRQRGTTDIAVRLNNIITAFESRLRSATPSSRFDRKSRSTPFQDPVRPMSLYILTNGLWEPRSDAEKSIRHLVNRMMQNELHEYHFMIQFITFGNVKNPQLEHLDSGLDLPL